MTADAADVAALDVPAPASTTYAVGVLEIDTPGPLGRTLPTTVWYPAVADPKANTATYLGIPSPHDAAEGLVPIQGKFPLVVFSHGNQGLRQQSVFLTEALAAHGYVVAAPDHVGNTFTDFDADLVLAMTALRPLDVKAVIDRMLAPQPGDPPWFAGLVDPQHIAVTGHSFGGYTTLAVAGAKVEVPEKALPKCAVGATDIPCRALALAGPQPWDFHDARVQLAIPLAHCGEFETFGFQHASMQAMKLPVVLQASKKDALCPWTTQALPAYTNLGGPRALISMKEGNHFTYSDLCLLPPGIVPPALAAACKGRKPDIEVAHASIVDFSLAACDLYLRGQASARKRFTPGEDDIVTIESEGIIK